MLKGEDIHLRLMKAIEQGQQNRRPLTLTRLVISSAIRDVHIKQTLTTALMISATLGKYSKE